MATLELERLVKRYGTVEVIHGVDLEVPSGAFCVFVGPSGCGKSTLLRMIAGLDTVSGGEIRIDGRRVNELPAARRGLAMVVYNHQIPRAPIRGETVRLRVRHQLQGTHVQLVRIDEEHGNPKRLWQELGSPVYLKPDMVERLCLEAAPRPEWLPWQWTEEGVCVEFTLPPHGVAGVFDFEAWRNG